MCCSICMNRGILAIKIISERCEFVRSPAMIPARIPWLVLERIINCTAHIEMSHFTYFCDTQVLLCVCGCIYRQRTSFWLIQKKRISFRFIFNIRRVANKWNDFFLWIYDVLYFYAYNDFPLFIFILMNILFICHI